MDFEKILKQFGNDLKKRKAEEGLGENLQQRVFSRERKVQRIRDSKKGDLTLSERMSELRVGSDEVPETLETELGFRLSCGHFVRTITEACSCQVCHKETFCKHCERRCFYCGRIIGAGTRCAKIMRVNGKVYYVCKRHQLIPVLKKVGAAFWNSFAPR